MDQKAGFSGFVTDVTAKNPDFQHFVAEIVTK